MVVSIYSRKSKMTETGDSIQNQINICKDYASRHFGKCEFLIYEDEGFSGGNTDRPMFKKMIADAKRRKFDILICYRLDRVSRNVHDFSSTLEILEYHNIAFVSVTEQFDTSNPLGKAMLSIASVFAELERDTIAQRITDNFTELAKTGRYLTSTPPEGFKRKKMLDLSGKHYNILETIPEEIEKIKLIYQKYLEWESNTKVQMYCCENGIKTKAGNVIKADWITRILTHQLYATADEYTYEYFKSIGAQLTVSKESFNGRHGITVFRRTKREKNRHNKKNDGTGLMIGVGAHDGIISSQTWIAVQNIISKRAYMGIRKSTGNYGLLNGLLRCSLCGDYMRSCCVRDGKFHYVCVTKERSRKNLCNMKNAQCSIDIDVINEIKSLLNLHNGIIYKIESKEIELEKSKNGNDVKYHFINKKIKDNEKALTNLIMKLSKTESEVLIKRIEEQVEKLDGEIKNLKKELVFLGEKKQSNELAHFNIMTIKDAIGKIRSFDFISINDMFVKRNILKTLIKQINWDGNGLHVIFLD